MYVTISGDWKKFYLIVIINTVMVTKKTYFHIHQQAEGKVPHIPSYRGHH